MENNETVQVECYSGYKANERPVAFIFHGERLEISEIPDRWYEGGIEHDRPIVDYFKVTGDDGQRYLIRHTRKADAWYLVQKD